VGGEDKQQGVFIVIEGTDGSGKGTQFELLKTTLIDEGYEVATFDFPRYKEPSSHFIKEYLNGAYGTADEVGPYTGSLFFALDRYEVANDIRKALSEGKVVLANRFTGSNMAHQGTKFDHPEERRGYFIWLDNLEFEMLGIPRPTKSFVLRMPAEVAQQLVDKKGKRDYTDKKRDIHEADLSHMQRSVEVYDDLCQLFPKDFEQIDCVRNGNLLSINDIQKMIWEKIEPFLPKKNKERDMTELELLQKTEHGYVITPAGQEYLGDIVTNVEGDVYAFTDKLGTMTIAAAMARLSRRGDDMRVTILDEFTGTVEKDEKLLQRVITAYGDDSVQQLTSAHLVVEGASNLLTKQLEWGRLASYLEQSTRYIFFDERDKNGKYKYYTPESLSPEMAEDFDETMNEIFGLYSEMVHELTDFVRTKDKTPQEERDGAWKGATRAQACDAVRPVLPAATKSTVGIHASGQALEMMIMRLRGEDGAEARRVGNDLLQEARKIMPTFLERADQPERGGATTVYMAETRKQMAELALKYLPNRYGETKPGAELISVEPRNELDLVPYMLYKHGDLSLSELHAEVDAWPIERKEEVFNAYFGERYNRRHKPGRAVEQARYTWDIMCDYGIFRDLQRHRMVDDLEWQALTPRHGFDTPELISEAGLDEKFERCFELSAGLYSRLQAAGFAYEAQYATLLGHQMRWTITYNAREAFHLHELRTSPQGHPGYRKLVKDMHDQVAQAHPLMAEGMKFVNRGEDAELTRLAAERYTQKKLELLDQED
jgi:thymidylate kinase/thymidylate synthase ThyX